MAERARMIIPEEDYEEYLPPKPAKRKQISRISQEEDVPDIGDLINKRRLDEEEEISKEITEARKKDAVNIGENRKQIAKQLHPKGGKRDKGRRSAEEYGY